MSVVRLSFMLGLCLIPAAKSLGDSPRPTIAQALAVSKDLTIFNSLVVRSGLGDLLELNGPFTLLAPTDHAMGVDLSRTELLELDRDRGKMVRFLANHILPGKRGFNDINGARSIESWVGQIQVSRDKGVFVEGEKVAKWVTKDTECSNGVLHVIDGILKPRGAETFKSSAAAPDLCVANYTATQAGATVTLFANGVHFTSGYKVYFEAAPPDVFPPVYKLFHVKPTGIVSQTITPFSQSTSFEAKEQIKAVTIIDAKGTHNVEVSQVPKTD